MIIQRAQHLMDLAFELRILDKPATNELIQTMLCWHQARSTWHQVSCASTGSGPCSRRRLILATTIIYQQSWSLSAGYSNCTVPGHLSLGAFSARTASAKSCNRIRLNPWQAMLWSDRIPVLILDKLCCNQMEFHRAKAIHLWLHLYGARSLDYELMSSW
jgi:hypothetical protein